MSYDPAVLRRATARLEGERRAREERQQALRRAACQRQPRLSEIDRQLRGTMTELFAASLRRGEGGAPTVEEVRRKNLALQQERAELLARMDLAEDALDDKPACPLCGDTGWRGTEMCRCLRALGARVTADGKTLRVQPVTEQAHGAADCGESGATLRFLLPVAAALGRETTFRLHGRLPQRPLGPLLEALEAHGVRLSRPAPGELLCAGRLESGRFLLPGDVSSQFFSGLLFALPLPDGPSELIAVTPPESAGYIAMTLATLRRFGIAAEPLPDGWAVPGGQRYRSPGAVRAEGDWSNAAFWLAAGALSRPVTVTGLQAESGQGDRVILEYLRRFGAEVEQNADAVTVRPAPLHGCSLDVRSTPDLAPPLALLAACAAGTTRITGAARLRYKESDRLASIAAALRALGADVRDLPDGLEIAGGRLTGGTVDACGDHRIAMLAAIVSARCDVRLRGAECVEKSDPHFWQTLAGLRSGTEESR